MPAEYVVSGESGYGSLGFHIRVERPVRGRALITADDPLAAEIGDWMEDPQNRATGLWGLCNVEMVEGEGAYYHYGFSDADTALRFRERWGKMTEPA
jgi:hypothetical protein